MFFGKVRTCLLLRPELLILARGRSDLRVPIGSSATRTHGRLVVTVLRVARPRPGELQVFTTPYPANLVLGGYRIAPGVRRKGHFAQDLARQARLGSRLRGSYIARARKQHSRIESPDPHKQGEVDVSPRFCLAAKSRSFDRARQSRRLWSSVLPSTHNAEAEALGLSAASRVENLLRAA
jgi:hypothetical protein